MICVVRFCAGITRSLLLPIAVNHTHQVIRQQTCDLVYHNFRLKAIALLSLKADRPYYSSLKLFQRLKAYHQLAHIHLPVTTSEPHRNLSLKTAVYNSAMVRKYQTYYFCHPLTSESEAGKQSDQPTTR